MKSGSSIAVIVVSKGRPAVLRETLEGFPRQTLKPSQVIVVVTGDEDLPPADRPDFVEVHQASASICIQRNVGISHVAPGTDYVAFFDDDFELKADYLEAAVAFLDQFPAVAAITGEVLRDGDIGREEAKQMLAAYQPIETYRGNFLSEVAGAILYGCCMIIRRPLFDYERFDENLPLYAFAEDYDISIRLKRYGNIGRCMKCVGIHLKTPSGRVNEVRRGYSTIANNWYFLQKGVSHLPPGPALFRFWTVIVLKQFAEALMHLTQRDKFAASRDRLKGLLLAVNDIAQGRSSPRRILDLPA